MPLNKELIVNFFNNEGSELYFKAENTIERYSMRPYLESGVLVGLSGGSDSIFLLCFLLEYRRRINGDFPILAVHINHGIRGEEADRDEYFCRDFCDCLGVELLSRKYDVPSFSKSSGIGLEEAARNIRYSTFNEIILGRNDISAIAVAHNQSDSAETVLFNILRGAGSRGASGISPIRDNIIRPLITIKKSELVSALDSAGISYVTDSSNLSCDYSRNYIRNEVMPILAELSNDPEKMIARFSDNLRLDDDFLMSMAKDFLESNPKASNQALLQLHPAIFSRVIKLMASSVSAGVSSKIIEDIFANLSNDNFTYSVIGGVFSCERGECKICKEDNVTFDYCVYLVKDVNFIKELNVEAIVSDRIFDETYLNVYKKSIQADVSSAIINGKAYFRPKKDGDSIFYGGMTHKLKKLFNDRKIPLNLRKKLPVLCDDKGVVWVPGFGVRDDDVPKNEKKPLYILLGELSDKESLS